jgi:CRISPR-associated protein Cmr3
MPTWIIEPRDPLIVRDGRPFGPDPGVRAAPLPFPLPATTTGAVRHKAGLRADGIFDKRDTTMIAAIKQHAIHGPLLVRLDAHADDQIVEWFAPAPADALSLETDARDGTIRIRQLVPLVLPASAAMNLPSDLLPVGQPQRLPNKPLDGAPRFWRWERFEQWLRVPIEIAQATYAPQDIGLRELAVDWRVHVSIQPGQQTAVEGALFQTGGLVFTWRDQAAEQAGKLVTERLALAVTSDGDFAHFVGGVAPIGGERRLAAWRRTNTSLPACPVDLPNQIAAAGACRVVLLTPAMFTDGALPQALLAASAGVTPQLIAAVVPRAQVISGWDLERDTPKPTRRLAPAGAVYFIRFAEHDDPAAITTWVRDRWMTCVSDDVQDCRDGFGLAAFGVAPREGIAMEVSDGAS